MKPKNKTHKVEMALGSKVPKKTAREVAIKIGTKLQPEQRLWPRIQSKAKDAVPESDAERKRREHEPRK